MKPFLPLFVFVDACGWEIIKDHPFARTLAPERRSLRSVFGYSSACIPSILSGRWPVEHRNWCYFVTIRRIRRSAASATSAGCRAR